MATALDIITSSARLIGVVASGEALDAAPANDGLITLNQMLSSWSLDRLLVYSELKEAFTWAAAAASKTIGPTGDFVTSRPTKIDTAVFTSSGIDYALRQIGSDEFQKLSVKSLTTSIPELFYYDANNTNATLYLYAIPSGAGTLTLSTWRQLPAVSLLATPMAFPPGYERAFRFNLAIEMANEWGVSVKPETAAIARDSLALIRGVNTPEFRMQMDPSFPGSGDRSFNINRGW